MHNISKDKLAAQNFYQVLQQCGFWNILKLMQGKYIVSYCCLYESLKIFISLSWRWKSVFKQLIIFVESKKKFLIWEFSSDLYHIYTIDFNCFDVRNGQWFYNSMRPKRCLVDLDVVWRSWGSSFGKCVTQRNALNSKMSIFSLIQLRYTLDSKISVHI